MRPVLFDSSIYIGGMRRGDESILRTRRFSAEAPVWLSAVVLEELLAGASGHVLPALEQLEYDFNKVKRLLIPNLNDWTQAGRLLARVAGKYHYENIGLGRLTNDALIAMSASRMGVMVITNNGQDFRRLAEFRDFRWEIAT